MFIILISILLSFMSYFLNRICLFSCFSFGGAFFTIARTRFFISTFSQSTSSKWIHVRGLFILRNNVSWHWAMACRNWKFQWTFPWYNYEIRTKFFNIISSLSQVLAFIFALSFQYISNVDTAFYFLTIFCVFSLLTVVLKFTVQNFFLF